MRSSLAGNVLQLADVSVAFENRSQGKFINDQQ